MSSRHRSRRSNTARAFYRPTLEPFEDRLVLSTFLVTTNADDGSPGTLRAALQQANADASPDLDVVDFALPTGQTTIQLQSDLPVIQHPLLIDGTSQPGYSGTPLVTIASSGFELELDFRHGGPGDGIESQVRGLHLVNSGIAVRIGTGPTLVRWSTNVLDNSELAIVRDNRITHPGSVSATISNNIIQDASFSFPAITVSRGSMVTLQIEDNFVTARQLGIDLGSTKILTVAARRNQITTSDFGTGILIQNIGTLSADIDNNQLNEPQPMAVVDVYGQADIALTQNSLPAVLGVGVYMSYFRGPLTLNISENDIHSCCASPTFLLNASPAGNQWSITNNTFSKRGRGASIEIRDQSNSPLSALVAGNVFGGDGLAIYGSAGASIVVENNEFDMAPRGVFVVGNGTTAGNIDLGSDAVGGSTGENDFSGFQTATGSQFAIGLFRVATDYTVSALDNLFSVDPTLVIADGSHDADAHGTGMILV